MASEPANHHSDAYRLAAAEQTRRGYLAALGIVQYAPRLPLPHARESVEYAWDVLTEARALPAESVTQVREPASPATPAQPADQRHEPGKTAPAGRSVDLVDVRITAPPEPTHEQATRSSIASQRFSLCVSKPYHGRLLVVQPERGQNWLNAAEQRLTDDLMRAVAQSLEVSGAGQYFHWPLLPSPGQPHGVELPPDAFRGFMEAAVQRDPVNLIIFSGRAASRVFPDVSEETLILWAVAGQHINVGIIPPLGDMLRDWQAKAIAWRRMRSWLHGV